MPSRSHSRCKVCRVMIHARHRFGMCKSCSDKHYARLTAQRKAAKERQAHRALVASIPLAVLEEGPTMPDTQKTAPPDKAARRPYVQLTDAQQVEILDAYTQTDEPVKSLSARFGIKDTYIYNVLDRVGVSWRRGNPESFLTWQTNQRREANSHNEVLQQAVEEIHGTVPAPVEKALENMLRLPPKPEPVAPTPSTERRVHHSPPPTVLKQRFIAEVGGFIEVEGKDMIQAIEYVKHRFPDLRVTSIREA